MNRRITLLLMLLLSALSMTLVQAAPASQVEPDPNARITFPPPVYVVRGEVEVRGTANVPNMLNYFLEYRPLADDLSVPDEDADWIPATLPRRTPIADEVLGVWNTEDTADGLYELRLTINVTGQPAIFHRVSPLRVENEPPPFVIVEESDSIRVTPTRTLSIITRPTLGATPTPLGGGAPTVTAITDANVRQGDSVVYPTVGSLLTGQSAQIIGRSPGGWYYIQLNTGRRGFISPSVVTVSGNVANLQIIQPPATPTPTFTPTPPTNGNLLINGGVTSPSEPRCNQQFDVQVNITNNGARATNFGGTVRIEDIDVATNTITATATGGFPTLTPGQNFVVVIPITVSTFPATDHRIVATVDAFNQILEENESDNTFSFTYRLRRAGCP